MANLMRQAELPAVVSQRFRLTTDSKHVLPVAPNLLARDFDAPRANVKWASDITYVWTGEGWLYLAVVLDLFSRRVVGWSMQARLDRALVVNALRSTLCQHHPGPGLLHHSDRGRQYASSDFQALLSERDILCSMSHRGNCWVTFPAFGGQQVKHRPTIKILARPMPVARTRRG